MTTDELVKDALSAVADQARLPAGMAHAAWRQRTRMRIRTATTTAAALVAAVTVGAITVPSLIGQDDLIGQNDREAATRVIVPSQGMSADPGHPTPRKRVAAGRSTLTAYASCPSGGDADCSWSMLDPASGGYATTPWGWVDVAPGGRTAAVLEKPLPARRIGLLDTTAGTVRRWIDLDRAGAGSVAWSPDGQRLLVTTYDRVPALAAVPGREPDPRQARTGFFIVDVDSGTATFHSLPSAPGAAGLRDDLSWDRDGSLIWEETGSAQRPREYYDLTGRPRSGPAQESFSDQPAGLSPNGRRLARGGKSGSAPFVLNVASGKTTLLEPPDGPVILQSLAWADDTNLIAWARDREITDGAKSRYRLVLVGVEGEQPVTPLTGWTAPSSHLEWVPAFTTES
ncbi:hypothetical protein [Nonomuraea basaltis]|uniref:hypothetical protein n=1 Tax=Nonomuraea basaltis TaxID=2495887 RepID=UPI00110C5D83|nr:hypothetical protein [Nonomuraea basaltis]TMR96319.1 hypothetical protein EJK15_23850 [Nonomuraea basaltis]